MLKIIQFALRKPISIMVLVMGLLIFSVLALKKSSIDIFPVINAPTIYVSQTYSGLSPQQMEGFITSYYEYHFLYITGIKSVESKSIQGLSLLKLQFHAGTDMANAMAEVVSYVNRARSFMPPGTLPPFIMRYDAGSVPVGQLVFTSETRSLNEIQDLALFKVRPMFSALDGVSAPPPLGGNQKTIVIKADPERMRSYNLTADELVTAIAKNNSILPAGNIRVGDKSIITPSNSVVDDFKDLENVAVKNVEGTPVYVRDLAQVTNGADIATGYALINGKRSVYIPVTKRADAATWTVVGAVRKALPDMQAAIPEDIRVSYELDQSGYVSNAIQSLVFEGLMGAFLTGLMVLLFLRDWRSAIIIVINIPLALLISIGALYLCGQTINIMTLGGLALAVGILVDESTVTIENIHQHREIGVPLPRAIWDACKEIATAKLLILLSILAVFVPALIMTGITRSMFLPLSLAVGFAMICSFLLSQTLVPVLANWFLKKEVAPKTKDPLSALRIRLSGATEALSKIRKGLVPLCIALFIAIAWFAYTKAGTEIFPKMDAGQLQFRLRLPAGTRIERTEDATKKSLLIIDSIVGKGKVAISSAYVGLHPQSYAITPIFLFNSGPNESLIKLNLNGNESISIENLKEQLRLAIPKLIPGVLLSFEPANLVDQVMSLGSNNPIELVVQAKNISQSRVLAEKLKISLNQISYLRDIQIPQPLDYPTLQINFDRLRTGQMNLTIDGAGKSITEATSSSRLTQPVYWLDKPSGTAYQVQVEYPQLTMNNATQLEQVQVGKINETAIQLRDIAELKNGNSIGEYDRINQQRFISITANIHQKDLGTAVKDVNAAIQQLGTLPAGVKVYLRGQSELLQQNISELLQGLVLAIVIIVLLLAAYFQSFKLSLMVLSVFPGVLAGSILLLWITGNSMNIQSFMGCIMALGVAVANAILLITSAENLRSNTANKQLVGSVAAISRFRPILITSLAMIAGMVPMAIGLGEAGRQTAPLAIAVIGGLLFSSIFCLMLLPLLYDLVMGQKQMKGVSLDPNDKNSEHYDSGY